MADNLSNIISSKIKSYFREKGMTQEDIAAILKVSQSSIWAQLNGKPFGKKQAKKWGDAFGFNPNWLMFGEGVTFINSEPEEKSIVQEDQTEYNPHYEYNTIDSLNRVIDSLSKLNDTISRENEKLRMENEALKNQIIAQKATG